MCIWEYVEVTKSPNPSFVLLGEINQLMCRKCVFGNMWKSQNANVVFEFTIGVVMRFTFINELYHIFHYSMLWSYKKLYAYDEEGV